MLKPKLTADMCSEKGMQNMTIEKGCQSYRFCRLTWRTTIPIMPCCGDRRGRERWLTRKPSWHFVLRTKALSNQQVGSKTGRRTDEDYISLTTINVRVQYIVLKGTVKHLVEKTRTTQHSDYIVPRLIQIPTAVQMSSSNRPPSSVTCVF